MTTNTIEVQVGEEILVFPDTMTEDQMSAAIQANYGAPTSPPIQVGSETPVANALESAQALPGQMANSVTQGLENYTTQVNNVPGSENPISAAANIARPGLEIAGQVAGVGMDAWMATYGQIPGVKEALETVANTDIAKKGIALAAQGMEAWEQFADVHPTEAAVIADAGVLAEVGLPKFKPRMSVQANKLRRAGNTQAIDMRREKIGDMIASENKVGEGVTGEKGRGPFRQTTYELSPEEDTIAKAMETIDTINPDRSLAHNLGKIDVATKDLQAKTEKILKSQHRTKIDTTDLIEELELSIDDISNMPGYHSLRGDPEAIAKDYLVEATRILKDAKKTPMGLLEARREFDRVVNEGGDVFGSPSQTAKKVAAKHIRDLMNEKLLTSIGAKEGDAVYDLLNRQHNLIKGTDLLKTKKAGEANSAVGRTFKTLSKTGHLPSTLLGLAATGSFVTGSPLLTAAGGVFATGAVGLEIFRGLKGPKIKQVLGKTLQGIDKAMKATNEDAVLAQLKADRIAIVELMKAPASELETMANAETPQQEP